MLKTNLATRPFYNEAAVRLALGALALLVVAATVGNLLLWNRYSRSDTAQASAATADETRAAELRAAAQRLRASVNTTHLESLSADAAQANDLIGRRTFSWTALFNRFEATIPADVRITSVRQKVERDRGTVLTIAVVARHVDHVNQFMDNLEGTGAFVEVLALTEVLNETGELEAVLETAYRPGAADGQAPPAAAQSTANPPAAPAPARPESTQ